MITVAFLKSGRLANGVYLISGGLKQNGYIGRMGFTHKLFSAGRKDFEAEFFLDGSHNSLRGDQYDTDSN